ncbi:uncharacterized protein [Triticum aestivum]|uniref:uncharacterized protein isoform X1 n=1 Tax=Triticum aestivum TaxID=4565 RepID=UPI001D01CBB6|nr:uncharacterized protein LOC123112001 isoform X1 [Triticum aestivum]
MTRLPRRTCGLATSCGQCKPTVPGFWSSMWHGEPYGRAQPARSALHVPFTLGKKETSITISIARHGDGSGEVEERQLGPTVQQHQLDASFFLLSRERRPASSSTNSMKGGED